MPGRQEKRIIVIEGQRFNYILRTSARARYIRLQFSSASGLELIIPRGVPVFEAEDFLKRKSDWILKNAGRLAQRPDGSKVSYLGEMLEVRSSGCPVSGRLYRVEVKPGELLITRPEGGSMGEAEVVERWMKQRAQKYIPERARQLAQKHGFSIGQISIRAQKTRWGSCSGRGNLSFNYRLMSHRPEVIDYVIIHELCHLRQMNHSEQFWMLVEKILPAYKQLRRELKNR